MRAVVQRVREARIEVAGDVISEMGPGLLALVGVGGNDGLEQAIEMARKLVHLRIFDDEDGRMNRSVLDVQGTLGVVSQFTLYGETSKGRRPSYGGAAGAEAARPLIEQVAQAARELSVPVVMGRFQADMQVYLLNDGPVTLWVDTEASK
ncbi:MAG: D-tyrosyl-tRNA(Tyr) deacylase [Deltaproteobacteria bacterium]|nr:D-tyrosyl-tRNA(Tyr) deacylase [Deltaproteobacteria bacterium]